MAIAETDHSAADHHDDHEHGENQTEAIDTEATEDD